MTFCFSFEVLEIQYKEMSKEEGLHYNNQGGGTKICTITSGFLGLFCHTCTTSQLKKKTRRNIAEKSRRILTKLLISQLLIVLEYQT